MDNVSDVSHELASTIISLQGTIQNVRKKVEQDQQEFIFDPTQPIGHLLDSSDAQDIISLAKPTSEMTAELQSLEKRLAMLQQTLTERSQWHPPPTSAPIPCSTDFLDLSDLSTAVNLIANVVKYSNPTTQLTPQQAFAQKSWTWDPLWREFFTHDPDATPPSSTYLSRWYFDPGRAVWQHANMVDSGLTPDEAQLRLGSWEDWRWDPGCGEWGLDVTQELEEEQIRAGAKLWVFASKWQEREGIWMYIGGRGA